MADRPLLAVLLPRREAAAEIDRAWDRGEAVLGLDPRAPAAEIRARLEDLRPTHLVDVDGRRLLPGGVPVDEDVAAVVGTSGTTGTPRGVELSRAGMQSMGHAVATALGVDAADTWLVCQPRQHVAGLAILARCRVAGVGLVVQDGFDVAAVASAPEAHGATVVSLVPTMLHRWLERGAHVDRYRTLLVGGAALAPTLRARAEAAGANVVATYGLSETWGGCVHEGWAERDLELRLGASGEIQLRGPVVMRGYRLDVDGTAAAFTNDRWLKTGDLGELDARGRLRVVDRIKDLVVTGGVNVSPFEVETVLSERSDIADVCVTGAPDDEWGERVVAHVVPAEPDHPPSLEDLRAFARDRLAEAKLPRELRLVAAIPRTASGKPRRATLATALRR